MTLTLAISNQRMTAEQYEAERTKLKATYGDSGAEAVAKREQALALLFDKSGWTQDELAAQEGKSRPWIVCQLRFGTFLNFVTSGNSFEIPPNLTERRFRGYWERTDKNHKEHSRFAAVAAMMKADLRIHPAPQPRIGHEAIDRFCDGRWYALDDIAEHLGIDEQRTAKKIENLKRSALAPKIERKPVGKSFSYRIFKPEKMVSAKELTEKLGPIIKELTVEGRKNMTTMCPPAVLEMAVVLQRLLDEWNQVGSPSA